MRHSTLFNAYWAPVLLVSSLLTSHGILARGATIAAQEPVGTAEGQSSETSGEGAAIADEPQPEEGVTSRDPFFGIVQSIHDPEMAPRRGLGLGAAGGVVVGVSAQRPGRVAEGVWPRPDVEVQRARGIDVVGVVLHTPPWAARNGGDAAVSPPHTTSNCPSMTLVNWGQFMARLAREYAGAIDTWIIWNELRVLLDGYGARVRAAPEGGVPGRQGGEPERPGDPHRHHLLAGSREGSDRCSWSGCWTSSRGRRVWRC